MKSFKDRSTKLESEKEVQTSKEVVQVRINDLRKSRFFGE